MPSALVELGYISTPDEERYLKSAAGQKALARSIYKGFKAYKNKL
jgi:N-acetylmuramoyl-L-alanine amidase